MRLTVARLFATSSGSKESVMLHQLAILQAIILIAICLFIFRMVPLWIVADLLTQLLQLFTSHQSAQIELLVVSIGCPTFDRSIHEI